MREGVKFLGGLTLIFRCNMSILESVIVRDNIGGCRYYMQPAASNGGNV